MADGFAGLRCSEERHRSMGGVWGCVAMTVVLLAEAKICGCIVHVDTFSDRSDEGAQRIGTDQRDKLIGVTSCDLSDRADLSTGWGVSRETRTPTFSGKADLGAMPAMLADEFPCGVSSL